jgi:hypothetical protein
MNYTYRERHGEAIYRFKGLPSRRRGTACSERLLPPQRRIKLPGGRHRHSPARCHRPRQHGLGQHDVGSDYPHSESTFPQSRKILPEILEGVPDDEQAKLAPDHDPGIAAGNTARMYNFDVARLTVPA